MFGCKSCPERFWNKDDLKSHEKKYDFYPCLTCAKEFKKPKDLAKHIADTEHRQPPPFGAGHDSRLQHYLLRAYYPEKVKVTKDDREKSRSVVKNLLDNILWHIRSQKDGDLYKGNPVPAGSTATHTKIIKADEFDYNLVLAEPFVDYAKFEGEEIKYKLKGGENKSLRHHLKIKTNNVTVYDEIPNGYIEALHGNNANCSVKKLSNAQKVIPRWVQEDLFKKIDFALDQMRLKNVTLLQSPHGPAITLHIKDPAIPHVISIDLSVSIDVEFIKLNSYDWPRKQTKKVLTEEQIEHVKSAGMHLVPKKELYWYVSSSKAAKALLNILDGSDDCRRVCHKILKRDFQSWKSKSKTGMHGISTYLFKHHLLWMNEDDKFQKKDYWRDQNIGQCYMDMLADLASKLEEGKLMNYFKHKVENILEEKRPDVLIELATCLRDRHTQLMHIKFN